MLVRAGEQSFGADAADHVVDGGLTHELVVILLMGSFTLNVLDAGDGGLHSVFGVMQ